jgi:hypothetical protein
LTHERPSAHETGLERGAEDIGQPELRAAPERKAELVAWFYQDNVARPRSFKRENVIDLIRQMSRSTAGMT